MKTNEAPPTTAKGTPKRVPFFTRITSKSHAALTKAAGVGSASAMGRKVIEDWASRQK